MHSPVYTLPSDFSTPKPRFYQQLSSPDEDFCTYLSDLHRDVDSLCKELEEMRSENGVLKGSIQVLQKEKEKHIATHAREKHDLEKALLAEQQMRAEAMKELKELKEKYEELFYSRKHDAKEVHFFDSRSEKKLKVPSLAAKTPTNIKGKLNLISKEHQIMKKKLKKLEIDVKTRSPVYKYED
jgi:hypothetical protein